MPVHALGELRSAEAPGTESKEARVTMQPQSVYVHAYTLVNTQLATLAPTLMLQTSLLRLAGAGLLAVQVYTRDNNRMRSTTGQHLICKLL